MVGRREVAGEHRRAVPERRRGARAGASLPAQAAGVGTTPTPCAHGEPDAVEVASPVRRAAARRPPADKAGTGASPLTLRGGVAAACPPKAAGPTRLLVSTA